MIGRGDHVKNKDLLMCNPNAFLQKKAKRSFVKMRASGGS